jgi:SNF2 family DNA or RNA helicase
MDLRPYQHIAADFLFAHDRAMILAPVGAGKTAITLTALDWMYEHGALSRVLVLAPKRVCLNVWPVEIPKWSKYLSAAVAVGSAKQRRAAFAPPAENGANVVIMNYENIQWLAELLDGHRLADMGFSGVVFDELTKLKNPSGKRFKDILKLLDGIPHRWGLTGSFTSNGLIDVFGQCKVVDQALLGRSKGAFLQRYFYCVNRDFGQWEPLPNALPKVMETIKPATYVLEPGEYKDKLPPLHVVEMRCDLDDRTPYENMKKEYVHEEITAPTAAALTNKLQQLTSGFAYDGQGAAQWFGYHKFDALRDILDENQRDNTIIVYNYKEELAELQRRYKLSTIDDDNAIENWNKGEIELLAIHPKSAGHGLNLQFGGNKIVFLSLPWSLELFEQTMGRLHRSGQTRDVWCYVLMCNKTIDERIFSALHDKKSLAELALAELSDMERA